MFEWIEKGGIIMYPLLGFSLMSLTIVIERVFFWTREKTLRNQSLIGTILELIEKKDYEKALDLARDSRDFIVRAFASGLRHHHASLEGALEMAAGQELKRMRKYMNILDTIITVAPLLGILGTVVGIIISFDVLGYSGIEDPKAVTGGIAQALLTTAAGLSVAILTIIPFNYFNARVEDAATEMESQLTSFEILYKKGQLLTNSKVM